MKGLGAKRNRHLSDSCDPTQGPPEPLYSHQASTLPRSPYLLSPTSMDHYGTMDPRHYNPSMEAHNQGSLPPDYSLPLNNQLSNSSTFPHVHYNSHYDPSDFSPPQEDSIGGISTGTLGTSMSMGMGIHGMSGMGGLQSSRGAMITSGSATISGRAKMNRQLQPNLLDQLEKQLPGGPRDGFSTLQFHRSTSAALSVASKQRTDSPGRIRNLVCSVQKLFAKSQSMDGHNLKGVNGRSGTGSGSGGTSSGTEDSGKRDRRAKSKDRGGAKSDGGGTGKRRPRSNMSGYWSSDDLENADLSNHRNRIAMTLGHPTTHATQHTTHGITYDAQQGALQQQQGQQSRYVVHSGYNTISSSKSSNEVMKYQQMLAGPGGGGGGGGGISMGVNSNDFIKGGSWSTLTLGQPRQVLQKGHSATLDRSMLKSKSCQQELACHYLQVGRQGDWSSTLGRSGGGGGANEIPCRRMRSGSYVKAMGDLEDSDDSDGSPKPSPKMAARRQSYLRATQQSLSDQLPPRNCLPSLRELSTNRSLDNLDCLGGPVRGSLFPRWDDEDFSKGGGCSTLGRSSYMGQLQDLEMISQRYDDSCSESAFRESHTLSRSHSQAVEPPDLPMPTCFRSRSHSYLRAIQAGCSQDDDTASVDSDSPPPTATTVRTYSTSTVSTCITTCKKPAPPPVPPRTTSKPYISVTVQSSTESAQETYLDHQSERDRRSKTITSQSSQAHSNSSDSLDSTRANSLARGIPWPIPVPVATPREPITTTVHHTTTGTDTNDSQREPLKTTGTNRGNLMAEEPRVDIVPQRKLSSIGIQVDCIQEEVQRVETPTPPLARFQSIGIQADDGWQLSRSSSMASKQETDSDTQDLPVISHAKPAPKKKSMVNNACQSMDSPLCGGQFSQGNGPNPTAETSTSPPPLRQFLNRSTTRSSSDSFAESLDPALDPSFLPPPDPWLESGNENGGSGNPNAVPPPGPACRRDGHWFLKLLQAETGRMEGWCQQMEQETKDNQLSEEVLGKVRSAVGSAQLLMTKKFEQFRGLCEQNLNVNANLRPTAQDLAGFWDLLQLSIEDISLKFDELYHLKSSDWQPPAVAHSPPERKEDQKEPPPPVPKKPVKGRPVLGREKSVDSASSTSSAEKHRTEARKRLLAAKRAASVRQNSATESADSIEIYVPEAQTRL